MELPESEQKVLIKSLSTESAYFNQTFDTVELLGGTIVSYHFDKDGLHITLPQNLDLVAPLAFKIQ
jgi:hypothetical protein